jgi:hypothetical protein
MNKKQVMLRGGTNGRGRVKEGNRDGDYGYVLSIHEGI